MPQMSPMWWTLMFTTFILSFLLIWTIMYFQTKNEPIKTSNETSKSNSLNWKW